MGRRSRKRGDAVATRAPAPAPRRPRAERPRAPWHPFPLVELSVLIGLVLLVWGLIRHDDDSGRVLLVCGMALASLGGLETALREHFSGFASHALLLAALLPVLTAGVLFFAGAPAIAIPLAAAAVLATAFTALRRGFRRRG
jgi:putative exporter of polyketide antibiotics